MRGMNLRSSRSIKQGVGREWRFRPYRLRKPFPQNYPTTPFYRVKKISTCGRFCDGNAHIQCYLGFPVPRPNF
jgi:hypothetical protein